MELTEKEKCLKTTLKVANSLITDIMCTDCSHSECKKESCIWFKIVSNSLFGIIQLEAIEDDEI